MFRRLIAAAILAALSACGNGGADSPVPTEPNVPKLTGTWVGEFVPWPGAVLTRTLTLTVTESDGSLTGSCSMVVTGAPDDEIWTCSVLGSHTHPDVSIVLREPGFNDLTPQGECQGESTIRGVLNGTSGLSDTPITLRR